MSVGNSFFETPRAAFQQSILKARGALEVCPDGVASIYREIGWTAGGAASADYDLPVTKARGHWKITLKFEVFGTPPAAIYPMGYGNAKYEDVILSFFRFARGHEELITDQPLGQEDAYSSAQWVGGKYVSSSEVVIDFTLNPSDGTVFPWQVPNLTTSLPNQKPYPGQPSSIFGNGISQYAFGRYGITFGNVDGFYNDVSGLCPTTIGFPNSFTNGPACTKRISFTDLVPGYVWQDTFTSPEVPYCSPSFLAAAYVPSGEKAGLEWTFPAATSDNPLAMAWRLSFTATRVPQFRVFFKTQMLPSKTVKFTDLTIADQASYILSAWHWDFGDGNTADIQNPTHTYNRPGSYDVTLTVTNPDAEQKSHTATIVIPFAAKFAFTPKTYPNVQFTDQSLNPESWLWDFGDGTTSNAQNPLHAFPNHAGLYTVTLTVTDGIGGTASYQQTVTLGPVLAAHFTFAVLASPPAAPHTVQFTDTSTGNVVAWAWQFTAVFGVNVIQHNSTARNPLITFEAAHNWGTFLQITDTHGFTASINVSVPVP